MYAIIDIETSGGSYKSDRITEIAIYIHDGIKIVDQFQSLVNPERSIPYFITTLTGITNEMVEDAPKFYEIAKDIVEITEGKIFVAHNSAFDYSFIKNEFKSLGYDFKRDQLCTVRLSRKLIPGYKSYSLGNLCDNLGIMINGRHRAAGDALATVKLFEKLLEIDKGNSIKPVSKKISSKGLNEKFDINQIEKLPEEPGVYYFLNERQKIIYTGKSKNIRKRVLSHLSNEKSSRAIEMKSIITEIDFVITGNELIALLLESDEIKKHKPVFNRAQRRNIFINSLIYYTDQNGYLRLQIDKTSKSQSPLTSFVSMDEAKNYLYRLCEEYSLCQKLCGLYSTQSSCFQYSIDTCNGACIGKENADDYNRRVLSAIEKFEYESKNFLIIDKGRSNEEKSVIFVSHGKYVGFGYFEPEETGNNLELIKDCVRKYQDNRDVQSIIRSYIKRNSVEKIIKI